jgi:type VI secretion system secreted protein VgrG
MSVTQEYREIEFISPLGKDVLLLRDMKMTEELGRLFVIDLELLGTEYIKFEDLLGQNVSIRLSLPGDKKRFFNGYVGTISQATDEGNFACYYATVYPWLWFLTRTSDCRIFQKKTVLEIIKEVFKDFDSAQIKDRTSGTYRKWEYCVQYRETDFNFVSRLMESEGIYYYFTHQEGKHTLILADAYSSHDVIPDYQKIPFYPPNSASLLEKECVSSWNIRKQLQPGAYVLNEYDFAQPKADLKVDSKVSREHNEAKHEIYDYPGEYIEKEHGSNYAKTRIQELHTQYEQAQGQSIVRGITTGGLFSLAEYPRADQNREYLIISVKHSIRSDNFEANVGSGGASYINNFSVLESNTQFRPSRITPKPIVQGPQTALVVGASSEEIHTDEHGRVKLQFHWDRYGKKDENSSCWIRVSQVHAGKGFGGVDIPRIGEEVIVSFEEGDPDRPIVTGRVFNGDNKPPNNLPANKMVSGLKSNSTPGGGGNNAIMLNDTKGKEDMTIHAQKDSNTTVENNRNATVVSGNDTIAVQAGTRSVTVKGNTSLTVQAGDRIVNVTGNYKLDTTSEISMQAPTKITLTCGGSTITMEPSKITISAGAGAKIVLDANALTQASAGNKVFLDGNALMNSTAGDQVLLDGKATMSSPSESKVDAPTAILSGGGSTVKNDASGVAVNGPKVSLNG